MNFESNLKTGQIAEGQIATWLRKARGWDVLPVYEIEKHTGKGPQLFTPDDGLIAPDMLALKENKIRWIEAKCKTVFSWHRISQKWTTGIDLKHYADYKTIALRYPWELWLLFLHTRSSPRAEDLRLGCPAVCPTGLFGGSIVWLMENENHRSDKYGNSGMVYWADSTLRYIADLDIIQPAR